MKEMNEWLQYPLALPSEEARQAAEIRQASLTKPPGALGRLEEIAIQLATLQDCPRPCVDTVYISVFAADHGVAAKGVSTFPQSVTTEMLKNFSCGGAAINVLARQLDAELEVINLGTVSDSKSLPGVLNLPLGSGTANFCQQPAMNEQQLASALQAGKQAIERAKSEHTKLFIGGEMGIGNTTAATALACAFLNASPSLLSGPGTGLNAHGIKHKTEVICQALAQHSQALGDPLETLRRLGGFEIAALSGSYVACAHQGLPVLVDGFISSVAALAAARLCPGVERWFLFSHTSAEPGHRIVLETLNAQPLLDLGLRLGEGSGAAVAVPLLRLACALHNEMATFAEAGLSGQST